MEACHILLGRPWQSDRDATHRGQDNVYIFIKDSRKIILTPMAPENHPEASKVEGSSLLTIWDFMEESKETSEVYAVVVKGEEEEPSNIPPSLRLLLNEFKEVWPEDLLD